MYEVLKMGRLYKLSVKIQLDLFDKMIKPILLYGCEVWGFGKNEVLERVHFTFSNVFYRLSRNFNENGDTNLNWVYFIRTILNECESPYIWETENVNNKE
jgi:hypothetical protein